MKCDIITIGDELLIGQVVDTNSAEMARMLAKIGVDVREKVTVSDTREHIVEALRHAAAAVPLVLITGGLGPTKDDITKTTLAEFWHDELVRNEEAFADLEHFLTWRKQPMNELNERQAWIPARAELLHNVCGSAPGMWYAYEGVVYVSMPGVPQEMRNLMRREVLPRIVERLQPETIVHRTLVVSGIPESRLAMQLDAWERALPESMKLAYLPAAGIIRLRLTAKGPKDEPVEDAVEKQLAALRPLLGEHLLAEDVQSLEEMVGQQLRAQHAMLATAESCTGGNIARRITSVPGSSDYFAGSVVAYQNRIKSDVLHVSPETLERYGAVSKETVVEMVMGVKQLMHADCAIAVSGIAGPGGGTPGKPVGTVWIAVASPVDADVRCCSFGYEMDRMSVIERATNEAFKMLSALLQRR